MTKPDKTFVAGFVGGVVLTVVLVAIFGVGRNFVSVTFKTPWAEAVAETTYPEPPSRGAEDAPITITEFVDFHCPFCQTATRTLEKVMKDYPEKIRLVFRHYPLRVTPGEGSFLTHQAAVCAQEQGKFWGYHDAIFSFSGAPRKVDLEGFAQDLGLRSKQFKNCLEKNLYEEFLVREREDGVRRGISGTPGFFVNDYKISGAYPYEYFKQVIEALLHPGEVELPTSPDAATPAIETDFDDLSGRPSLGPENALVTLVEFSDFHCPFCAKVGPTLQQLMDRYEGKVRRVFRHFPLSFHVGAEKTHEASECAHEQGKFWEFHKEVFQSRGGNRNRTWLLDLGARVGLDSGRFAECLDSNRYQDLVQGEVRKGSRAGVQGTPSVFVNGRMISGAQPYERFQRMVESELKGT